MRILIRVTLIDVDAEAGRKTDRKAQIEESDEMRHYIKQDRQGDRTLCSNALSDQSILLKDSSCHKESYSLSTLFLLKKKKLLFSPFHLAVTLQHQPSNTTDKVPDMLSFHGEQIISNQPQNSLVFLQRNLNFFSLYC